MTEQPPITITPTEKERAQECRQQAKALLALPGMRLHLALTLILCLTFWIGAIFICECAFTSVPWVTLYRESPLRYYAMQALYYLADALVIFFLGLPLLYGTARVLTRAARGEMAPLSTLFCAFAGPRTYFRSLGLVLRLCALPLLCVGLGLGLLCLGIFLQSLWLILALSPLCLVLLAGAPLLAGRDAAVLAMEDKDDILPLSAVFAASHKATRGRLFRLLAFRLRYVGWALLSIATLGLVTLFHALPYFVISYTRYAAPDSEGT